MRWMLFALLAGCGGAECEQVGPLIGPDGRQIYEITCVHECGMVLTMGWQFPAPSCEWEQRVCRERCAEIP